MTDVCLYHMVPRDPAGGNLFRKCLHGHSVLMEETKVGRVFKFFAQPSVAAIELTDGALRVGDNIHIQGATTDFTQEVASMEIEREAIEAAERGQSVGIKVQERVRPGDAVYRV